MTQLPRIWSTTMLTRVVATVVLSLGLGLCLTRADESSGRTFRAGAAVADITPPLGMPIVGSWDSPPATNVHDPLQVRALVLDDGETRIAFAICDSVGIPAEVFDMARRGIVDAELGLADERILLAATHTHSGVSAGGARDVDDQRVLAPYQHQIIRGIVTAVGDAVKRLQPARIGWTGVDEPREVHNRRWFVKDESLRRNPFGGVDQVRMNPPRGSKTLIKQAGPIDPEISYVSVQSASGQPLALLANYSLHYVGGVPKGDISADYFAAFADKVTELLGVTDTSQDQPFVAIMTNGTSGDINNIRFNDPRPAMGSYENIQRVATRVANRVAESHAQLKHHDWAKLGAIASRVTLRVRKPDDEMDQYFRGLSNRIETEAPYHRHENVYASRVEALRIGPDSYNVRLQTLSLGKLAICSIPFEVFAEVGLELKNRSPFGDMFTIELAGGAFGYLPTPRQHALGGYETWMGTNRVQRDASEKIVATLMEQMATLKR
ncbi:MAG: hypothetical protein AAGA03_17790 [Planctomycetota bacterium]